MNAIFRFLTICFVSLHLSATGASANCQRFPTYCDAAAVLQDQPNIDLRAGLAARARLAELERLMGRVEVEAMHRSVDALRNRVDEAIRQSQARVDAVLRDARSGGPLRDIDRVLQAVVFFNSFIEFVEPRLPTPAQNTETPLATGEDDPAAAEETATPGSETWIGQSFEDFFSSEEAQAYARRVAASQAGSRYYTVLAILEELEAQGELVGDGRTAPLTRQEALLIEGYSTIAGWTETEADRAFREFEPSISGLDEWITEGKVPNPYTLFLEIFFTSRPLGDGTVESSLNAPQLRDRLDDHADRILRWRYPEYFEEGVQIPFLRPE